MTGRFVPVADTCSVLFLQVMDPTDPPGQLNVTGEEGDPLGVDGTQVGVGE